MRQRLRGWLADLPIADPLARRQAPLLQLLLFFLAATALPRLLFGLGADMARLGQVRAALSDGVACGAPIVALVLLRRGHFSAAVLTQSVGTLTTLASALFGNGVSDSGALLLAFVLPIALAGLLLGWRSLLLVCGLSVAIVASVAWLQAAAPPLAQRAAPPTPQSVTLTFSIIVLLLFVILSRFGHAYRAEIRRANRRERELQQSQIALDARRDELEREVDRRQRIETQLLQSQKLESVGQLAGGIAHDFNNLLTVIQGNTELALSELPADSPVRADLRQVLAASGRASALTIQLLAFARKQVMERRSISLAGLVLEMHVLLQRLLGPGVELITLAADDLGSVYADPSQIEQVVINLVLNARDAMPAGGRLTIEVTNEVLDTHYAAGHAGVHPGAYVLLAVSDSGVGMPAEVREQIFEPFFTTKEPGKGTGLGLSMCYGIVKQHGGNIWVYSEPGQGSVFKIYLPQIDKPPVELGRPASVAVTPTGDELVLVAEDEPALRLLIARALRVQGYRVLEAGNGVEALGIVEGHEGAPIALLVTDVTMPKMSGRDLARQVALLLPQLKVLFLSGYSDGSIASDGQLAPGVNFMQKPFSMEALARRVRSVLDS